MRSQMKILLLLLTLLKMMTLSGNFTVSSFDYVAALECVLISDDELLHSQLTD
jgi:hypothetical protein